MEKYDTANIKQRIDLLALVGGSLKKVGGTRGGEYAGPCPMCGGRDRFHVQPAATPWPLWMCANCTGRDKWEDAIKFVMMRDNVSFPDACAVLGGRADVVVAPASPPSPRPMPAVAAVAPPSAVWQTKGRAFVVWAQERLWETPDALAYLRRRGLTDATIRAAGLGYNPRSIKRAAASWGIDGDGELTLHAGWVIPCELGGDLWYVKIRRPDGGDVRYVCIKGGINAGVLYGGDTLAGQDTAVLVEGELNALTLRQQAGHLVAVVSLGSAGNKLGRAAVAMLDRVRSLRMCYDPDAAGERGRTAMGSIYGKARRLIWPESWPKDINDAHRAGLDLLGWLIPQIGPEYPEDRRKWAAFYGLTDEVARIDAENSRTALLSAPAQGLVTSQDVGDIDTDDLPAYCWYCPSAVEVFCYGDTGGSPLALCHAHAFDVGWPHNCATGRITTADEQAAMRRALAAGTATPTGHCEEYDRRALALTGQVAVAS